MAQGGGKFEAQSLVGGTLGQFEIKAEIARGGMGVVYKGYQPSLDRWVAIKTLPMDLAGDRELVSRFQREAKAMSLLNHANIVQVIDSGQDKGQYYIAMEYVEGPSVKDLLKSETIDTTKIFDVLIQTCDGLDYAHKKNLVHRDIKPANLLYEEKTGSVKIADFGIAHFTKKDEDMLTLTANNVGMGTMNYMAPEQKVDAGGVDHRADIYAIGVIIYEAFTGKLPLGKFKLPSEVNPKLSRHLDAIVQKCLASDKADRYASCADVKAALQEARAATTDTSIRRSMRDALDRTLTAISPNRTVGYLVLGCAFVAFMGLIVGGIGWAVHATLQKKERDELSRDVNEKMSAVEKLQAAHAEIDPALLATAVEAAGKTSGAPIGRQIEYLTAAKEAYARIIVSAGERRQSKIAALKSSVDAVAADVGAMKEDGFKAAAGKDVEQVKAALAAPDTLDAAACEAALKHATDQVAVSRGLDANVKKLEDAAQALAEDKRAEARAALDGIAVARKTGDLDAANKALDAANSKLKDLGKPTEITNVTTPVTHPTDTAPTTNTNDSFRLQQASNDARDAQEVAQKIVDLVAQPPLFIAAGGAELDQGKQLEKGASDASLTTDDRMTRLGDAAKKFAAARDAASTAARAKLADAKAQAQAVLADRFAPDDAQAAAGLEQTASQQTKGSQVEVEALVEAIKKHLAAAQNAAPRVEDAFQKGKAAAEKARKSAAARGGQSSLPYKDGAAELARADELHDGKQLADALKALDGAASDFGHADRSVPKAAVFTSMVQNIKMSERLGFKPDELDGIAPASRGVVLAAGSDLRCLSADFLTTSKAEPGLIEAGKRIGALCAGEPDELYLGLPGKIVGARITGDQIKATGYSVPLEQAPFALAYDPAARVVLAGFKDGKAIRTFSAADQGEERESIDLSDAGGFPRSIAVLKDGTVAVVVQRGDPSALGVESSARYTLLQFKKGADKWTQVARQDDSVSSIAAVGPGAVGVDHRRQGEGTIVAWSSCDLTAAPLAILREPETTPILAHPIFATSVVVSGSHAWVLDNTTKDPDHTVNVLARRNRLVVFDLKD
jgi:serine/threonine protein kinase